MASLQDDFEGKFHASSLAKWFHSAPHKDFQLGDTTTIFSPSDKEYREALVVLAIFIASFGVLLFLLNVLFWTCCYCICRKRRDRRQNHSESCCTKSCLQIQVFILALVCSAAIAVGFIYNGKTSDGVDQFRNSVDDIQDSINLSLTLGKHMHLTLKKTQERMYELGVPEEALHLTGKVISNLSAVNYLLPEHVVNVGSDVGDTIHKYDNYRWLATVVLLSWCILLCIFIFWLGCQVNGCILVIATVFCLLTMLFTWTVIGADVGVATGIGDFCVHPKEAIQKIKTGHATSIVVSYYMDCEHSYDPFSQKLNDFEQDLNIVISIIENIPDASEILGALYGVKDNFSIYREYMNCELIHKEYMHAMDGLCSKTLNSHGFVILAVLVIAVFSALLMCCVCPLWRDRHPRPTTYNDIRNPQDDIGNSVLWSRHDVDAQSNESVYRGHDERTPLIVNQHNPNYETGNQPNVNFIHVDYHRAPHPREERQSNNRHSF